MGRNLSIIAVLVLIVALPFVARREQAVVRSSSDDLVLVIVTPHNEAIRYEFARGFALWHKQKYGRGARVEWRNVGGTTEISRYLTSEYAAAMQAYWMREKGRNWPAGATDAVTGTSPPANAELLEIFNAFRAIDDADSAVNSKIDVFFGGGEYDHTDAAARGLAVAPWPTGKEPGALFEAPDGTVLLPQRVSGETWRTPTMFGNAISTFGICYNLDRLKELGFDGEPTRWDDMANPLFFRQVGGADPDKSGSVAKAFEMMIHQKVYQRVQASGFSDRQIAGFEEEIGKYVKSRGSSYKRGELPETVPAEYQRAVERGWLDGVELVEHIGANARYFTDSSQKVPVDVSMGDSAIGMSIDFFGRYQAQLSRSADGRPHMVYLTPIGGSSVSCDPVSLLRGAGAQAPRERRAETRRAAIRFIEFVLSEDGQKIWTYKPGAPGGPEKYALRRLPIRRDFYPSTRPAIQAKHEQHLKYAADNLADPAVDAYSLSEKFVYWRRWTGSHFGVQRKLIRVMCIDCSEELKAAWQAINDPANASRRERALAQLHRMPKVMLTNRATGRMEEVDLNWRTGPDVLKVYDALEAAREWTIYFRGSFAAAGRIARGEP
ncbi:MAG: ABC transporter substrate-binding protein [Tepidisphaerales bacterium]